MKLFERGTVNRDLIKIVRNNVRENEKVVGDLYAFAACNEIGINRLIEMMQEFALSDLESIGAFILGHSERVVRERLAELPNGTYTNAMTLDGYDTPIDLRITLKINKDSIIADFTGTSPASGYGINVPLVYAKAYACYALMCAIAPEVPNNTASLSLFEATAPENCILNAQRPAPVSVRHVLGHLVPDLVFGALAEFMPERIPAEGASALWNIQFAVSPLPTNPQGQAAAMLTFNSGGTGARPGLDGLNATAFPSGVQTMPTESTEQVGPLIIWRKELRSGSGGAGRYRGGLGQTIEISAAQGYRFEFSAMFDRTQYPARGRNGGQPGKVGGVELDDGTRLRGKGRQAVPADRRLILKLPGGGGHGAPEVRDPARVEHDLRNGYILHDQVCQYGQCHKSSEQSNR
jgi:N-methylhydantoinase B